MPSVEFFPYMGPNRRSDRTVVEVRLDFAAHEKNGLDGRLSGLRQVLTNGGILDSDERFPEQALPQEPMSAYASLLVQTALLLQCKTGHRVNEYAVLPGDQNSRRLAWVEHEHCDVGMTAVKLASEALGGRRKLLAEPFRMFRDFARERLLPPPTGAVIRAAHRRDIPCVHLERQPFRRKDFDDLTGGQCICPNGLLMLGHGVNQHVLDGTYCVDLSEELLDQAFPPDEAAERILDRLYPDGHNARMPIVAVTGTNGKTTTTRMISRIMSLAGRKPGMVCTDGIFLDGEMIEDTDKSALAGHLKVLSSKAVDTAILETHHAGIVNWGFAFRWCDIALCLNVTEDHLGTLSIDTVEQMAEVKQALPERARHAAVLNADDSFCLAMVPAVSAKKVCLVSMDKSVQELELEVAGHDACFCTLEPVQGEEWIVWYDTGRRIPVMAVSAIPATFAGTAGFNTSNAMHAIAAAWLAGIELKAIAGAMGSFECDYQSTPGRMNAFDELPFRVIVDFAHNPDGMQKLCDFTDRQTVVGRKLVVFAASRDRSDETIRNMGRAIAGHFDFYFCKEYVQSNDRGSRTVAHLLQEGLMAAGVEKSRTVVMTTSGKEVIFEIFDACNEGDLLLMLMGHVEKHQVPVYIEEYAKRVSMK